MKTKLLEGIQDPNQFSAYQAILRYPNKFVHFSKVQKLGINPRKQHNDPHGIYFYYNTWLQGDDVDWSRQYRVDAPYYFICDIKKTRNSIDLSRLKIEDAKNIARRNGWLKELVKYWNDTALLKSGPMATKALKTNGGKFYAIMDFMQSNGAKWSKMLAGVDVVFDPGKSVINVNEPAQVIVLNPSNIQILEIGRNVNNPRSIMADVVKNVAERINGDFFWYRGNPGIKGKTKKDSVYEIILGDQKHGTPTSDTATCIISYFKNGIWNTRSDYIREYNYTPEELEHFLMKCFWDVEENAEPYGRITKWNRNEIIKFSSYFYVNPFSFNIPDAEFRGNILHYWFRPNFSRLVSPDITFTVKENDDLIVNIKVDIVYQYKVLESLIKEYEFHSTDTAKKVADTLLEDISEFLKNRMMKMSSENINTRMDKMKNLSNLNLTF